MIEVLNSRELTDKEKRKYELQQEIEMKQRELEKLNNLVSSDDASLADIDGCKHLSIENINVVDNAVKHGRERLQQKIGALTPEEEKVVSEAISKENQENALSDEQLEEIREKSMREYDAIVPDVRFSPVKAIILIAIMCVLVIVYSLFIGSNNSNINSGSSILHDAIENEEDIVIEVEID